MAKNATARNSKRIKAKAKQEDFDAPVDTKWVVRVVVGITILSIGLFIYFNRKAKERYERTSAEQAAQIAAEQQFLALTCSNMLSLDSGNYSLYGVIEDRTVKLKDFNVSTDGVVDIDGTELGEIDTQGAATFSIKALSSDGAEANFLSGDSVIGFQHKEYLASSEGSFVLDTPSSDDSDQTAGIWFGKAGDNSNSSDWQSTLSLPEPPSGWRYAVWIVNDNGLFLVGRFSSADGADLDQTYFSGSGPDVVGEDFLNIPDETGLNKMSLAGGDTMVGVTLEPSWYSADYPFPVTVLGAEIPEGTKSGEEISLELALDSLPYCITE